MTAIRPPRAFRFGLWAVGGCNAVAALVGFVGLAFGGGMGLPPEWLDGSAFDSYVWPGVILGVLVGGTQAAALIAQWRGLAAAWGAHAAAGLVLLIWIFCELALLLEWAPLQAVFFATGVVQIVLAVLALGAWPRPFWRRSASR